MSEYLIFAVGLFTVVASVIVGFISARKRRAAKVMRKHGVLNHQRSLQEFNKKRSV